MKQRMQQKPNYQDFTAFLKVSVEVAKPSEVPPDAITGSRGQFNELQSKDL